MWEVKGAEKIENKLLGRAKKQQHLPTTFTRLRKSVDKGCIILLSDEPAKPRRGSPIWSSHYFVFGTSLLSVFRDEGGKGIGFFEPPGDENQNKAMAFAIANIPGVIP